MVPSSLTVACRNRRSAICPPCSDLYQADAWILVAAGLGGGKGVAPDVISHPRFFVTLTAPSFGPVHRATNSGWCHQRTRQRCPHDGVLVCRERHQNNDVVLGTPLCVECFDYRGAVLWNHAVSRLWVRTMQETRRESAKIAGVARDELESSVTLNYIKVVEFQRRGLAHVHAIVRADGPHRTSPPNWLTSAVLHEALLRAHQRTWVNDLDHSRIHWGKQLAIAEIVAESGSVTKAASYLAKYATKTTTGDLSFAYRFTTREQIESTNTSDHLRTLALTCFDLASEPQLQGHPMERCANAFGMKGQLVTKSRDYSSTFQALRSARADHESSSNTHQVLPGSFGYLGRGYDDPIAERGAQILHQMKLDARREHREAKLLARELVSSEPL